MGLRFWKRKKNKAPETESDAIIKNENTVESKKNTKKKNAISLIRGLFKRNRDLAATYGEIGLDSLMSNELVNELIKQAPVLKTVIAAYESAKYIHQVSYIKRLTAFFAHIDNHMADEEEKDKYRQKITGNKAKRDEELKYILQILEQYTSEEKAKMLSSLYLAYLDEMINWAQFVKYSETIYQLLPFD